jgi:hypothetical protein
MSLSKLSRQSPARFAHYLQMVDDPNPDEFLFIEGTTTSYCIFRSLRNGFQQCPQYEAYRLS